MVIPQASKERLNPVASSDWGNYPNQIIRHWQHLTNNEGDHGPVSSFLPEVFRYPNLLVYLTGASLQPRHLNV